MINQQTLYLAPIRGITDNIYRNVFPNHFKGLDLAIAPFVATSQGSKPPIVLLKQLYPEKNHGIVTIPQILGKDPGQFIIMANTLHDMGYQTINWNLGCPFAVVVKKGKGSGLLPRPEVIDMFLDTVIPKLKSKLSIKLRLGSVSPDEIMQVLPVLSRYPLAEIIIHARTGKQMYTGTPNLDKFEQCTAIYKDTIVYNGDIVTKATYEMLSTRFISINRWMIGRGVLSNPFLAEEIKTGTDIDYVDKLKRIYRFHEELFKEYSKVVSGATHLVDKMKGIWVYLAQSFNDPKRVLKKITKTHTISQYQMVIENVLADSGA